MKAVVCTRYGAPDVLEIREVPNPAVTATDLLVRVRASAVNSADVRSRSLDVSGIMKIAIRLVIGWKAPRQPILGTVFAGEVVGLGENAAGFQVGDRVYGCSPGIRYGCHAEYMTIKADSTVAQMPKNANFEEAVALLFGGTTALYFLEKIAPPASQSLLVYGASGAVGTAAVQIGTALGLEVTGVSSGANEPLVRRLGASHFIDYTKVDYSAQGQRYDIVFDAVGKTSKVLAQKVLKQGGHFLTVGGAIVVRESRTQIDQLSGWYDQGKLKAVIDRVYPLDQAVEAHRYVDQGHKKGNVILRMTI